MIKGIHARMNRDDRGFTLIELMVVVLIIAILIAIAIPTFLGARTKSQDRAAQVDLRQGLLTAKSYYTDAETFLKGADTASTAVEYKLLEPSINFVVGTDASDTKVGVMIATATEVVLAKKSKSSKWVCIAETTATATVKFITTDKPAANPYTSIATCVAGATSVAW